MPRSRPFTITLSSAEKAELRRRAAKYTFTFPYFQVQRAKMILYVAQGMPNHAIPTCLDTRREVVSLWRKRFFADRLAGLEEHARPGRPDFFPQISSFRLRLWLGNAGLTRSASLRLEHKRSGAINTLVASIAP